MGAGHLFRTVRSPLEIGDRIFWKPPTPKQIGLGTRPRSLDRSEPNWMDRTGLDQTGQAPDWTELVLIRPDRSDWPEPDWRAAWNIHGNPWGLPLGVLTKNSIRNMQKISNLCKNQ